MAFLYAGFADEAGKTIEEQIDVTKHLGWDAIEVRNVDGTNFTDISDDKFEKTWETMQASGVKVAAFGSQLANWARPITTDFDVDVQEMKRAIPRMQKTGAKIIRCMSYPNADWSEDDWKKEVFKRLGELAKMAEDGGIIMGHENCNGYGGEGPDQTLEMLDAVGSPALKLIFDTGNPVFHGQDALAFYNAVKDHVVHVHIKDGKKGSEKEPVACYPDEGEGNVAEIMADLKGRGYDSYISIEPHMAAVVHEGKEVDDASAAAEIYVEYGKRIMAIAEKA